MVDEAKDFCGTFENYSYLWLEDRESIMEMFLYYGRSLTNDELDALAIDESQGPPHKAPNMDAFRDQIDSYENLFAEIENMASFQIFNSWFQVVLLSHFQVLNFWLAHHSILSLRCHTKCDNMVGCQSEGTGKVMCIRLRECVIVSKFKWFLLVKSRKKL